jgi:hypothetical protein
LEELEWGIKRKSRGLGLLDICFPSDDEAMVRNVRVDAEYHYQSVRILVRKGGEDGSGKRKSILDKRLVLFSLPLHGY